MGDRTRGLYEKYTVLRTDESDQPGRRHHGCELFVLDVTHDPHAVPALRAYAKSCRLDGYELLANDLQRLADVANHLPGVMLRDVSPATAEHQRKRTERDLAIWRVAITLANNLAVQVSDRINAEDGGLAAAGAAADCAHAIRAWLEPTPEQLDSLLAEGGLASEPRKVAP